MLTKYLGILQLPTPLCSRDMASYYRRRIYPNTRRNDTDIPASTLNLTLLVHQLYKPQYAMTCGLIPILIQR